MKFRVLFIALFAAGLFGLARLYYGLTDDFRFANIFYDTPNRAEWDVADLSEQEMSGFDQILEQQFDYIGKGAQSYAFGSADGKYVLKFFKFKHLRPTPWLDLLPEGIFTEYRQSQTKRKKRKLENVFAGYRLAFERHRTDSGLIYVHLNRTKDQFPTVTVLDKLGLKHKIDLDQVVFILQERAETMNAVIHHHLQQGDVIGAIGKIDAVFALYMQEYAKGIFDNDHGVMRNVGFVGNRPIHIDVGKLKQNPEIKVQQNYAKDLDMVAKRMSVRLKVNEADSYPELKKHIEARISQLTGAPYTLPDE